jgi:anti-sigma factor RsiW
MNTDLLLQLQSWIDGELSDVQAAEMEARMRKDPQLRALAAELRGVRRLLRDGESRREPPCPPEFYWQGIERELGPAPAPAEPAPAPARRLPGWLRVLLPVSAGAAALLALFLSLPGIFSTHPSGAYAEIETPLADISSITFRSETEHMTIVWVDTQ